MLRTAFDLRVHAFLRKPLLERFNGGIHFVLSLLAVASHERGYFRVILWLRVLEGKVFQLPFELPDSKAVREGGENLQRLRRHAKLTRRSQRPQCPHIVQPVRKFNDDDAEVFRHRHENFAQVRGVFQHLRLLFAALGGGGRDRFGVLFSVLPLPLVHACDLQFRHTVHQMRYFRPEKLRNLLRRDAAVFNDIVEQSSGEGLFVHFQIGENFGDFDGVDDVGFAGAAFLARVFLGGEDVGAAHKGEIGLRAILHQQIKDAAHRPLNIAG